jgi:hypothetical protein
VLRVKGVRMKAKDPTILDFHLGHFRELEKKLTMDREIKFVVIDPAGSYIGRAGVNENKDADLRAILDPLSEAASKSGAMIGLVKHLNKTVSASAVQSVAGSVGYVNAVRFAYVFLPDPEDPERKLLLPMKNNVLKANLPGLAYRLSPMREDDALALLLSRWPDIDREDANTLSEQLIVQTWEGETTNTADGVLSSGRRQKGEGTKTVEECVGFIRSYLGEYSYPDEELRKGTLDDGFTFYAFKTAKANLRQVEGTDPARLSGKPLRGGGKLVGVDRATKLPQARPTRRCEGGRAGQSGGSTTSHWHDSRLPDCQTARLVCQSLSLSVCQSLS